MTRTPGQRRLHQEADLQTQVCAYLQMAMDGNSWFSAIPLGGGGGIRGALLKRTGTKAGIPDIVCINDGRAIWLELKRKGGTVSDVQLFCHEQLRRARSPVYVCRNIDDVVAALKTAGFPLKATVAL